MISVNIGYEFICSEEKKEQKSPLGMYLSNLKSVNLHLTEDSTPYCAKVIHPGFMPGSFGFHGNESVCVSVSGCLVCSCGGIWLCETAFSMFMAFLCIFYRKAQTQRLLQFFFFKQRCCHSEAVSILDKLSSSLLTFIGPAFTVRHSHKDSMRMDLLGLLFFHKCKSTKHAQLNTSCMKRTADILSMVGGTDTLIRCPVVCVIHVY